MEVQYRETKNRGRLSRGFAAVLVVIATHPTFPLPLAFSSCARVLYSLSLSSFPSALSPLPPPLPLAGDARRVRTRTRGTVEEAVGAVRRKGKRRATRKTAPGRKRGMVTGSGDVGEVGEDDEDGSDPLGEASRGLFVRDTHRHWCVCCATPKKQRDFQGRFLFRYLIPPGCEPAHKELVQSSLRSRRRHGKLTIPSCRVQVPKNS